MLVEREVPHPTSSSRHFAHVIAVLAAAGAVLLIATMRPTAIDEPGFQIYSDGWNRPASPARPPNGWIRIDAGKEFSFYAPLGTTYRPLQGIDSFVGEIGGAHFRMQFDFGRYSAGSSELARDKDFHSEPVMIDGRHAEITSATDSGLGQSLGAPYTHVVALYISSASCDKATFAYGLSCEPNSLGIYGVAQTSQDAETIEKIYKTLRFSD